MWVLAKFIYQKYDKLQQGISSWRDEWMAVCFYLLIKFLFAYWVALFEKNNGKISIDALIWDMKY